MADNDGEHISITTPATLSDATPAPATPAVTTDAAGATTPDTLPDGGPDDGAVADGAGALPDDAVAGEGAGEGAGTDDPVIELPGGEKVKVSEILRFKADAQKAADYTQKTQALAEQRRALEAEKAALEQARTPKPNVIDPFSQQDQWKQIRYQQYVDAYVRNGRDPNTIDMAQIDQDHMRAQLAVMREGYEKATAQSTAREAEVRVESERRWLSDTIGSEMGRDEYKLINTPDGKEDVRGALALTLHEKGEITAEDIAAAVKKVHGRWHARVGQYVKSKQTTASATGAVSRGGGQTRAPEKAVLPAELDSLREIGRRLGSG